MSPPSSSTSAATLPGRRLALVQRRDGFYEDRRRSCVGRQTEQEAVWRLVEELLPTGGYVTITGEAGQGKSGLIARLVEERAREQGGEERVAFHFIPLVLPPDYQVTMLKALLGILLVAQEPLPIAALRQLLTLANGGAIDLDEVQQGLQRLGGLLMRDQQGGYTLFHLKLRDYLRGGRRGTDGSPKELEGLFDEEEERHARLVGQQASQERALRWTIELGETRLTLKTSDLDQAGAALQLAKKLQTALASDRARDGRGRRKRAGGERPVGGRDESRPYGPMEAVGGSFAGTRAHCHVGVMKSTPGHRRRTAVPGS